ncbi:MAG: hypothetical protein Q9169_004606 [Polycauliona sp. 2 TL-2023]
MSSIDALLCVYNRQHAWSEARPASALVLGDGQSFVYGQGFLAYVRDDLVRILDVHNARRTEGVIYTSMIGTQLLGLDYQDSEVELLHLQDALLTFIYRGGNHTVGWTSWILVLDITRCERLSLAVSLWTSEDLVVRNDNQYVCIAAPTGSSASGRHREWVCRVWDTQNLSPRSSTLQIPEMTINEVGQALVFEVFDGYLYAVSTQCSRETEEPEWTSYYTCVRFPLSNPEKLTLETIKIWRRHHREGPINDLWTDLQLVRDETTGQLIIIETRKEWTEGSSTQRRTSYRQKLPATFLDYEDQSMVESSDQDNGTQAAIQHDSPISSSNTTDPPYLLTVPPDAKELGYNKPDRLPCNTHAEYSPTVSSSSRASNSSLAKSRYRTYNNTADAFIDLIIDDRNAFPHSAGAQRLCLRIGSRKEASPLDENGSLHQRIFHPHSKQAIEGSELRYESKGIRLWPPADAPAILQDLLSGSTGFHASGDANEPRFQSFGDIGAIADERSMVYLVKKKHAAETDKGKLMLINFDQYIQFSHNSWAPEFPDLTGHEQNAPGAACSKAAQVSTDPIRESTEMDIDKAEGSYQDRADNIDDYQKKNTFQPADELNDQFWCEEFDEDEPVSLNWFQEEMALWTDIKEGFSFI